MGVGIIGAGSAARQHVLAVQQLPSVRVVGVAEPQAGASIHPTLAPLRMPVARLLDHPSVDIISICTPPGARIDYAHAAARAGRALLIEKPPAVDLDAFDTIVQIGADAAVPIGVMLQHRFLIPDDWPVPAPLAALAADVRVYRPRGLSHYLMSSWRTTPLAGGGFLAHLGVHYVDLLCQLLGQPVSVEGEVHRPAALGGIDTSGRVRIAFAAGSHAAVHFDSAQERDEQHLAARWRGLALRVTPSYVRLRGGGLLMEARPPDTSRLRGLVYEEVAAAVRGRNLKRASFDRSRDVMTVLELARRI